MNQLIELLKSFYFYFILASKYLVSTIIDPSDVQISSNIILFTGYLVISNVTYSLS